MYIYMYIYIYINISSIYLYIYIGPSFNPRTVLDSNIQISWDLDFHVLIPRTGAPFQRLRDKPQLSWPKAVQVERNRCDSKSIH